MEFSSTFPKCIVAAVEFVAINSRANTHREREKIMFEVKSFNNPFYKCGKTLATSSLLRALTRKKHRNLNSKSYQIEDQKKESKRNRNNDTKQTN